MQYVHFFAGGACTRGCKYYEHLRITRKNMGGKHGRPNVACFLSFFIPTELQRWFFFRTIEIEENLRSSRFVRLSSQITGKYFTRAGGNRRRVSELPRGENWFNLLCFRCIFPLRKRDRIVCLVGTRNTFDDTRTMRVSSVWNI